MLAPPCAHHAPSPLQWWRRPSLLLGIPIRLLLFLVSYVFSTTTLLAWQVGTPKRHPPSRFALSHTHTHTHTHTHKLARDVEAWLVKEGTRWRHPSSSAPQFGTDSCFFDATADSWGNWYVCLCVVVVVVVGCVGGRVDCSSRKLLFPFTAPAHVYPLPLPCPARLCLASSAAGRAAGRHTPTPPHPTALLLLPPCRRAGRCSTGWG